MADRQGSILPDFGLKRFETQQERTERILRQRREALAKSGEERRLLLLAVDDEIERLRASIQKEKEAAAAAAVAPGAAPKKLGGGNPIVPVVNAAGNSVVNAITALDQLFAANPPDP